MPALRADDPAHRSFFAAGADPGRVHIGQLETNGALRFGDLAVGRMSPAAVQYELWLRGTPDNWQLEIGDVVPPAGAAPGVISLSRQPSGVSSTLSAALLPATRDTAHLILKWGQFTATAGVQFTEPGNRRTLNSGRPNQPINRTHDEENVAARVLMLSQINETAMVLPTGARLGVGFPRSFPKGQPAVSAAGTAARAGLGVDGPDFARLMATRDGGVVQLTEAAVPRLANEVPVRFGKLLLRPGNQTAGHAGAYGLWLKRAGRGWRLLFSHEPDTWGTQHDPKFDVGEVALTYSQRGDPSRPFAIALDPASPDRGRLIILWGPHEWTADFTVGS